MATFDFRNIPTLETERLILRKMHLSDAEAIYEYAKNPEVSRYTLWDSPKSVSDTRDFVRMVVSKSEENVVNEWVIVWKESGAVIGTGGFVYWDLQKRETEIGYAISQAFWNRGIVTEAMRAVCTFAFRELEVETIICHCHIENIGSERVMQKLGMRFKRIKQMQFKDLPQLTDVKQYVLTKADFEGGANRE